MTDGLFRAASRSAAVAATAAAAGHGRPPSDSFRRLLDRLSTRSVERHWEAYRDIDWDHPDLEVHPDDPRWELPAWDPIGASEWYRDQPPARRAGLGLHRAAAIMRVAVDFESGLQQGLVAYASTLPNGHPAFRYAYHEVTEEAQHSMMFEEFVHRSGFDVPLGDTVPMALNPTIIEVARDLPALFFISVLSGEEPIDRIQRRMLRDAGRLHPLLATVNRIHCAEEARHMSFARAVLREGVTHLPPRDVRRIVYEAPFLVQGMVRRMTGVTPAFASGWGMPDEVRSAIEHGPEMAALVRACAAGVHGVCARAGLVPPRVAALWSGLGLI